MWALAPSCGLREKSGRARVTCGGGVRWAACPWPGSDVVLSATVLQDKEPRGIIPLENLSIREVEDSKKPVSVWGAGEERREWGSISLKKTEIAKIYLKLKVGSSLYSDLTLKLSLVQARDEAVRDLFVLSTCFSVTCGQSRGGWNCPSLQGRSRRSGWAARGRTSGRLADASRLFGVRRGRRVGSRKCVCSRCVGVERTGTRLVCLLRRLVTPPRAPLSRTALPGSVCPCSTEGRAGAFGWRSARCSWSAAAWHL